MNYTSFLDGGRCLCRLNAVDEQQLHTTDSILSHLECSIKIDPLVNLVKAAASVLSQCVISVCYMVICLRGGKTATVSLVGESLFILGSLCLNFVTNHFITHV